MRRAGGLVIAGLIVAACSTPAKRPKERVREEDLEAWVGVSLDQLETHPLFSTMPLYKRNISTGGELWTFSSCKTVTQDTDCTSNSRKAWGSVETDTNCSGGGSQRVCCNNQFFVKENRVESYRPVGPCKTDCSTRPWSVPCAPAKDQEIP